MLSTISAGNLSSPSSSSSSASSSISAPPLSKELNPNPLLMNKNLINTETLLLNELVLDFNTPTQPRQPRMATSVTLDPNRTLSHNSLTNAASNNSMLRLQKYKLFVEQTDQLWLMPQTSTQIAKQINKLAEIFAEFKKTIQYQLQLFEQINDPLVNLVKYSFSNELNSIFDGFSQIAKALEENLRSFLNNFTELTLKPIEQISKNFETIEKEQSKKSLDKAFKDRDIKLGKHRKNQKSIDLSSISKSYLSEEFTEKSSENYYLHQKICEYLSHVYAEKTSSFNQLVKSLLDFYKTEMSYLSNTQKALSSSSPDESHVEHMLKKFNADQSNETKIISELSTRCASGVAASENNNANMSYLKPNSASDELKHNAVKSCENLYTPVVITSASVVIKRSAERSPLYKSGYLLKKPHHQGVRNWLRRKCVAENGYLYIFHAEETESPIKLNLILCNIKVDDHRKFRLFSGSNNRVYDFMAENDQDLKEWVSILNSSKEDALEKEFNAEISRSVELPTELDMNNNTNWLANNAIAAESKKFLSSVESDYLVKSWIREVQSLDGNDRCCDCNSKDTDWLVTNLGILVCIECCGIHREMGVHVSKTQSIKIDRLTPSQLLIARMSGNRLLNNIFEASIIEPSNKLHPQSTMEQRQKYIKIKYEQHLFANQHSTTRLINKLYRSITDEHPNPRIIFDLILQLFAQNYDLMSPIGVDEPMQRNLLQLVLDFLDENEFLFLVEFFVQNRDFPKNEYTINYVDRFGNTCIHHAVMYNRIESLKVLLKAMSSVSSEVVEVARNRDGRTPLDLATSLECSNFLMSFKKPTINVVEEKSARINPPQSSQQQSKHNRVGSEPFNLIMNNHSLGTLKSLPRLLEDRKMVYKANKLSRHSEKVAKSRSQNLFQSTDQADLCNTYKACSSYVSKNPSHLSFKQNDLIVVVDRSDDQYWFGYLETNPQKRGYFPSNLVNLYV